MKMSHLLGRLLGSNRIVCGQIVCNTIGPTNYLLEKLGLGVFFFPREKIFFE